MKAEFKIKWFSKMFTLFNYEHCTWRLSLIVQPMSDVLLTLNILSLNQTVVDAHPRLVKTKPLNQIICFVWYWIFNYELLGKACIKLTDVHFIPAQRPAILPSPLTTHLVYFVIRVHNAVKVQIFSWWYLNI